jgi:hypothetical protein
MAITQACASPRDASVTMDDLINTMDPYASFAFFGFIYVPFSNT